MDDNKLSLKIAKMIWQEQTLAGEVLRMNQKRKLDRRDREYLGRGGKRLINIYLEVLKNP